MSLKSRLRERLAYLDQDTRERVIDDALAALDQPTRDMVEEGKRLLRDESYDVRRGNGHSYSWLAENIFTCMVAAGRWGGA